MSIKDYIMQVLKSLPPTDIKVDFELLLDDNADVVTGDKQYCNVVKFSIDTTWLEEPYK